MYIYIYLEMAAHHGPATHHRLWYWRFRHRKSESVIINFYFFFLRL